MKKLGRDLVNSIKVLVVDDDAPTCELIRDVLIAGDMEAFGVTDSSQAAKLLVNEHFDAVFLDENMPPPNGIELVRQMRTAGVNRRTFVVMITGSSEQHFLKRAFDAGVDFVLFKPVDRQTLLRLLRTTQGLIDRERRRYTRVNVAQEVLLRCGDERANGKTENLSVNGFLARTSRRFPVGARVRISLTLNEGEYPLLSEARVVRHVGDDMMGIELEGLPAGDSERLQEFIATHILGSRTGAVGHSTLPGADAREHTQAR